MKQKQKFWITSAIVLTLVLAACLGACSPAAEPEQKNVSSKDVYALSALSGANYLTSAGSTAYSAPMQLQSETKDPFESLFQLIGKTDLKNYLTMFDDIVAGDGVQQTTEVNASDDEEFQNYRFVMTITCGETETVKMYFNEIDTVTETEVEDGVEESETSTTLQGVLVVGEKRFEVSGKREVEKKGSETEVSIEFTTYASEDKTSYVTISHSTENDNGKAATEYEYELYLKGKKVCEFHLETEVKEGLTEYSFQVKSGGIFTKTEIHLQKNEQDGTVTMEVEALGTSFRFTVQQTEDGFTLVGQGGNTQI